jgi:hypothetical protein
MVLVFAEHCRETLDEEMLCWFVWDMNGPKVLRRPRNQAKHDMEEFGGNAGYWWIYCQQWV